ncbi:MAG: membrane integrity-associated transporter subunit PqiC [Planctomycetes bacterium]|nr:membrane integrity-associated transporter subunit PqiC [Planctomycetota bacterium]
MTRRATLMIGLVLLGGCLSKSEVPAPRFFRPGPVVPRQADAAQAPLEERAPLRLRDVSAAAHLRDRMVWSTPALEYGFYDGARWTEAPASYVEAALTGALFERGAFRRGSGADAPVLDVHVAAFEEVVGSGSHEATVVLRVLLVGPDGAARLEDTFVGKRPVPQDDPAAVAAAMGEALDEAVRRTVAAVEGAGR